MRCPTCHRTLVIKKGKVVRHTPLYKVPGRKICPMSGQPVDESEAGS